MLVTAQNLLFPVSSRSAGKWITRCSNRVTGKANWQGRRKLQSDATAAKQYEAILTLGGATSSSCFDSQSKALTMATQHSVPTVELSAPEAVDALVHVTVKDPKPFTQLKMDGEGSSRLHSPAYAAGLESAIRALHRVGTLLGQLLLPAPSNLIGESAFLGALAYFWPLFEKLLTSRHMENSGLAIAICKSLSDAIQAGGKHFSHLLPSMMAAITSNFPVLLLRSLDLDNSMGLYLLKHSICTTADAVSSLNSPYKCDQEPDLAEAYMNTSTFVRCCPEDVLAAGEIYLESALNKATICCTVLHKDATFAAMSYISSESGIPIIINFS